MQLLVEKLPLADDLSFVANVHTTPKFEVPWHQHIEYEIILFLNGDGHSYIGNYVGEFNADDLFFIGSNLPHTFQKNKAEDIVSAVVIHFKDDFWGSNFLSMPECKDIQKILEVASRGLSITGELKKQVGDIVKTLVNTKGFDRILLLSQCLNLIASSSEFKTLSTQEVKEFNLKNKERIEKIFQYTIENFQENIKIGEVAKSVQMSIPAFCTYFKKSTKKTYIDFLNEIRVGYACKQLVDTSKSIESICYESGYNTVANFNKQFGNVKNSTPSKYRRDFSQRIDAMGGK